MTIDSGFLAIPVRSAPRNIRAHNRKRCNHVRQRYKRAPAAPDGVARPSRSKATASSGITPQAILRPNSARSSLILEYYNIPPEYFTEKYGVTIDSPREAKTQPDRFFRLSPALRLSDTVGLRCSYLAFNAALGSLYEDDLIQLGSRPPCEFDDTAFLTLPTWFIMLEALTRRNSVPPKPAA